MAAKALVDAVKLASSCGRVSFYFSVYNSTLIARTWKLDDAQWSK